MKIFNINLGFLQYMHWLKFMEESNIVTFCYDKKISKNKALQFELSGSSSLFQLHISSDADGEDHARLIDIELILFGFDLEFNIYDVRHWDYDNNCWKKYGEPNDDGDWN